MTIKKGQSRAFPSPKKHYEMARGWCNDFARMQSTGNAYLHKDKREFFDRPVKYTTGMNSSSIEAKKPGENYHNITPVRSDKQSR